MSFLKAALFSIAAFALLTACSKGPLAEPVVVAVALKDVSAERLSYRYEADVPAPDPKFLNGGQRVERNEAVQLDFDTNRVREILDRTIASPSGERILAVYRQGDDVISDFRLDMYSKDGKLLRKVTHEEMALQFPDTIVWSPDGNNVAFVAKTRGIDNNAIAGTSTDETAKPDVTPEVVSRDGEETPAPDESASEDESETDAGVEASKDVITFRTEQIYICNTDGGDVKPLTKVEGLMYFYFVWAPDGGALAALAAIHTEWQFFETRAKENGQVFIPRGRPRLIEKSGRERRLDDLPTPVHPVWSPDSAKVAVAFDKQIRIYDGVRNQPSQAAIPLKNELLISSRTYEKNLALEGAEGANGNVNADNGNVASNTGSVSNTAQQPESALPDPSLLVSFNPIVKLVWPEDKMLYFETGFVRNYLDETESVRSYMRWHRLILSAQAVSIAGPKPAQ